MFNDVINFIRKLYDTNDFIPLHAPEFSGNEKKYLIECIDSTFVSSVGKFVDLFERNIESYTGVKKAVVTVNGTAALHLALILCGVKKGDEVITQSLTFIATANAISYTGASPVFVDVDKDTLGMSPDSLQSFLDVHAQVRDKVSYNKLTGNRISACVPMHTFGHPARIDKILEICKNYHIELIEDAAESIGSKYINKHTGLFGKIGVLSFNGNKTITTGGGGMIITNDEELGNKAKHLSTQAKIPHPWEYDHDSVGFNYRMPNINAALGVAQLERIDNIIANKRQTAEKYKNFFSESEFKFITEPENCFSNYWLNALLLNSRKQRDDFLQFTNENKVMTRPIWKPMHKLEMFKNCLHVNLNHTEWIEDRLVNLPSSVRI